jgi:predicted nucleic acid-binding Zn ribbon protein
MKTIELRPAHTWDCDDCGRENFCRGVVAEPSEDERREMEETTGEAFVMGHWMTAPDEVTCAHCGATFT